MNSIERIRATIEFREIDRPAVIPELFAVTATLNGVSPGEYVKSGKLIAQCQSAAQEAIGHDAVFASADINVEAEAIGSILSYTNDNYPFVARPALEEKFDLGRIDVPAPATAGRMPEIGIAVRELKKWAGNRIPVMAAIAGPPCIASRIMDLEKMMYMIVDEPERYNELLSFCAKVAKKYAAWLIEQGADGIVMFDPVSSPSLIPPRIYNSHHLEPVKEVFRHIRSIDKNIFRWYSVAGPVQLSPEIISGTNAHVITIDYMVPLGIAMNHSRKIVINGNIKPMSFFDETPETIMAEADRLIAGTRKYERFILGSGCEIPINSPLKNIKALVSSAEKEAGYCEPAKPVAGGLSVKIFPYRKQVYIPSGSSIMEALGIAKVPILHHCDKSGSCGKCVVHIKNGQCFKPDALETMQLVQSQRPDEARLACLCKPLENTEIYIPYINRDFELDDIDFSGLYEHNLDFTNYPFQPNILASRIEGSVIANKGALSYDTLINELYEEYKLDFPLVGKLSALIQAGGHDLTAVINSESAAVLDFSGSGEMYGVALDLGTTTICGYIHDLNTGKILDVSFFDNPQKRWGAEIMSRATYAMRDQASLQDIQDAVIDGINSMLTRFHRNNKIVNWSSVYELVVAGNPVMIHLFLGINPAQLVMAPFTPAISGKISITARDFGARTALHVNPRCNIELLPGIGGFVGSDIVAGILASGMHRAQDLSLFVDIGTNGEFAIGNREKIICTSVAAGPAFEGAHITNAYTYQPGMINRIWFENERVCYQTIGETIPFGLCGSAVVDIVAELLRHGLLNRKGKFIINSGWRQVKENSFVIVPKEETGSFSPITISSKDIEEVQKAKSSIRTGLTLLIEEMGAKPADIKYVYVSGAFGLYINMENAKALGLFPDLPEARFTSIKNSAGIGARCSLLSLKARRDAAEISAKAKYLNLIDNSMFYNMYIDNMFFPVPK